MNNINILLIDPIVSPEKLINCLQQQGVNTYIFFHHKLIPRQELLNRLRNCHFEKSFYTTGRIEDDVTLIKKEVNGKINICICGFEESLSYTENLAIKLGTYINDPKTSNIRTNKQQMLKAAKQSGCSTICSINIDNSKDIEIIKEFSQKYYFPLILKPSFNSVGSFGLTKCYSLEECINKVNELLGAKSISGSKISELVLQEYISGDEYIIDSYSQNSKHFFSGAYYAKKRYINNSYTYQYFEAIYDDKIISNLYNYSNKLLNTLGVENGFSHIEVIDTGKSIELIELNPRLSGCFGWINKCSKLHFGLDQVDIFMQQNFDNPISEVKDRKKYTRLYLLQNYQEYDFLIDESKINSLKTYYQHYIFVNSKKKKPVNLTLSDTVGFVILHSNRLQDIVDDTNLLFSYEVNGTYNIQT